MKKMSAVCLFALLFAVLYSSQALAVYKSGTHNGYFYSYWFDGKGSVSYSLGSKGNYSVRWSNVGNFTLGKGWNPGSARTVGYNVGAYSNSGGGTLGLYGWTTSPLIEYYVNEMWGTHKPTGTYVGTLTSDGGTYTIYKSQRVNAPSIQGTKTFWQYYSTRNSQNSKGANHTITSGNHFNAWKNKGLKLGTHNYMILLTEGWGGSGSANVTVW